MDPSDELETPLHIIKHPEGNSCGIDGQSEVADSEYRGSAFKKPITHVPPISKNWPTEDEAGRISASDAYKILFTYRTMLPHFIHLRNDFSSNYTLHVPVDLSRHLPKNKHQLKLHNKGNTWSITKCYNKNTKTHSLTSGWQEFIDANEIRSGDVCIFDLVGNCEVNVLILKVRDPSPTYVKKVESYLKSL